MKHVPGTEARGGSFSVEHCLYIDSWDQSLDPGTKVLSLENLSVMSSFRHHSPVKAEMMDSRAYEVYSYSDVRVGPLGISGELDQDLLGSTFGFRTDLSELPLGSYIFNIRISVDYAPELVVWSKVFTIDRPVLVSDLAFRYFGGMEQVVELSEVRFYLSADMNTTVPTEDIVAAECEILHGDLDPTGVSVGLKVVDGVSVPLRINVSSLEEDQYMVRVKVRTVSYGSDEALSSAFELDHHTTVEGPEIGYDPLKHTLDLTDIEVISSYMESNVMPVEILIVGPSGGISIDVTSSLRYFGGTWSIRDLEVSSLLPEGDDYFLRSSFWVDGEVVQKDSATFSVFYELLISDPSIEYIVEYDLLDISKIFVTSPYNSGAPVPSSSLVLSVIRVFNSSSDEFLLEKRLEHIGGMFRCEITRPTGKLGAGGLYAEVIFSTALSGNHSIRTEEFIVQVGGSEVGPSEDLPENDEKDGGPPWYIIVLIILISLVLGFFLLILVSIQLRMRSVQVDSGLRTSGFNGDLPGRGLPPTPEEMPQLISSREMKALPEVEYLRPERSDTDRK
ncbi:MAG: hypothetical protein ACMUHY_09405 [Thermoplasmatota archaeon]